MVIVPTSGWQSSLVSCLPVHVVSDKLVNQDCRFPCDSNNGACSPGNCTPLYDLVLAIIPWKTFKG